MKYLRQYQGQPKNWLASEWAHIKADSPKEAAIKGLTLEKIGDADIMYAYVAPDTPTNKHRNGKPFMVHRFELKINRP